MRRIGPKTTLVQRYQNKGIQHMQASPTCMGKSPMVKVILEARKEVDMESTAQDAMYTQNTTDATYQGRSNSQSSIAHKMMVSATAA